ncbi:MAG: sporulation integral membrane protein YtvI [Ruminococcaceae bacterium]|nr:sporulation integral membrane protein YtvI [Oscillospiraceae bacterium]
MLPQEPYKKFAVITLYAAVGIALAFFIFNYLWGALLPFLIAYLFAECFRPIVKYSESHKSFPKKSFVLFVILLAAAALSGLVFAIARQVYFEISELAASAREALELFRVDDGYAGEMIEKINGMIPFVDVSEKMWESRANLDEELWSILVSFAERLSGGLIDLAANAAAFLPNALLCVAVVIIATYYFAIDRVKINCFFLSLFPKSVRPTLKQFRDILAETVGKYLRAYGVLFFITFGELLLAFVIMGVEYSFVFALVISLVDILPVLGTGTVLIPWGIISITAGNYGIGIGLLVTYAVITVVRQVIEPKIVGKFIGLSPLASLAAMYIGLKLMGIFGLFAFPLGAIAIKRVVELKKEGNTC